MSEELQAYLAAPPTPPYWSDRAAVVNFLVAGERRFAAPDYFDEVHIRQPAEPIVDRSTDIAASLTNTGSSRRTAIVNVGRMVAPGGTLIDIAARRQDPIPAWRDCPGR